MLPAFELGLFSRIEPLVAGDGLKGVCTPVEGCDEDDGWSNRGEGMGRDGDREDERMMDGGSCT